MLEVVAQIGMVTVSTAINIKHKIANFIAQIQIQFAPLIFTYLVTIFQLYIFLSIL